MTERKLSPEDAKILDELAAEMEAEQVEDMPQGPVVTQEMLKKELAERKADEQKAVAEAAEERLREDARFAFRQANGGAEPTKGQIDALVVDLRARQAADMFAQRQAVAGRQVHQMF